MPLKSSRQDVERLLGKPDDMGGYKINEQYAFIYYSSSNCTNLKNCECLVGKDIVTEISVQIQNDLELKQLNLNLKKYKKESDKHLLVYEYYSSDDEGVTYTVFKEDNTITKITFFPSKKDCNKITKNKTK